MLVFPERTRRISTTSTNSSGSSSEVGQYMLAPCSTAICFISIPTESASGDCTSFKYGRNSVSASNNS